MKEQFMPNEEQEFAVQTVDNVTHYDDFGVGVIEPTGEVSDTRLAVGIEANQRSVEAPQKVCIDKRVALGTLNPDWTITLADKQPVREKLAGGLLPTMLFAAKNARWSGFTDAQLSGPIGGQIEILADYIVEAAHANSEEIELGAHIATGANPDKDKTGCGAVDNLPEEHAIFAEHGVDESFEKKMQNTLGDNFDEETYTQSIANAVKDEEQQVYSGFRPRKIADTTMAKGGIVEVLDASNKRPDIDPEDKRHGHYEEAVHVNTQEGTSNDRDNPTLDFFQVDAAPLIKWVKRMAADEAEFSRLLHAAVAFQYSVEYKLTKNLPNFIS